MSHTLMSEPFQNVTHPIHRWSEIRRFNLINYFSPSIKCQFLSLIGLICRINSTFHFSGFVKIFFQDLQTRQHRTAWKGSRSDKIVPVTSSGIELNADVSVVNKFCDRVSRLFRLYLEVIPSPLRFIF